MEKIKTIFFVCLVLLSSCFCDNEYQIASFELIYLNLSASTEVYLVKWRDAELDTNFIKTLNEEDNKLVLLNLKENSNLSYFICLESFTHCDTISNFSVIRGKCDQIKSRDFEFNNTKRTSSKIEVYL